LGFSLSHALKEDHRLRVSENRVLRRMFGPKREEMAGSWRRLHLEELRQILEVKEDEIGRVCSTHGRDGKCIQNFGQKTEREEATQKT
jgi:hypothetical protein